MLYYSNGASVILPATFDIPELPRYLQTKLDNDEPCHRNKHLIIRVLYGAVVKYTM